MSIFKPEVRSWVYGVSVATISLLVALGVLAPDLDETILNLIAAVLGLGNAGLATAYRPTRAPGDAPDVKEQL